MNPLQNDAFGSLSNGQGGGVQAGGVSGGVNNDSGGKVYSQMPIGSASTGGPIIINNGGVRKSRLWVVVPIVVLLFVVVIGIIIAVSNGTKSGSKNSDGLVYKFINLLASGKDDETKFEGKIDVASLDKTSDKGENDVQNIYTSLRIFDYDDSKNIIYYNALKNVLNEIDGVKEPRDGWEEIISLSRNIKDVLPEYFAATILADTDACYDYFVKHKNFGDFLSEYDFPLDGSKDIVDEVINRLFYSRKEMYEEILKTDCVLSDGIDYSCLDMVNNRKIKSLQSDNLTYSIEVHNVASNLLNSLVSNANSIINLMEQNNENEMD